MTDIFYDTEFLDDGKTIELISIGIVGPDKIYYAVNSDIKYGDLYERISRHKFLIDNVVPKLPLIKGGVTKFESRNIWTLNTKSTEVKPHWVIANEVRDFLQSYKNVNLWADYAAYDHVVLAQLFGPTVDLPEGIPMYTNDFQMLLRLACISESDIPMYLEYEGHKSMRHHALYDAHELAYKYRYVVTHCTNAKIGDRTLVEPE